MPAELTAPLNLKAWIDEHRRLLKPPVGSRAVWQDRDFIVQVFAGPIQRRDFHVNPTEELYFQIEGTVTLRCIDGRGGARDITVNEGDIFLLPHATPHAEQRPAGSVGLVVERRRPRGEDDHLRFYCDRCGSVVYDEPFEADDFASQVHDTLDRFWSDATLRTCVQCGFVVQHDGALPSPRPKVVVIAPAAPGRARAGAERRAGPSNSAVPARSAKPAVRSPAAAAKKRVVVRGR